MEQNSTPLKSTTDKIDPTVKKRRKPRKNAPRHPDDSAHATNGDKTESRVGDKPSQPSKCQQTDTMTAREKIRDRIRQMQKDRAKGSYVCEENANHEY